MIVLFKKLLAQQFRGLTIIEVVVGIAVLMIAVTAVLGAHIGQVSLNQHARNLLLISSDANRIVEQLRQQNVDCTGPSISISGGWDAWLAAQNPGKSVASIDPDADELVVVTCQNEDASEYCNDNQVSDSEWMIDENQPDWDPLRVSVSICWRHRGRTIGECAWGNGVLAPNDIDGDGLIESPVQLVTLITCRSEAS